MTADRSEVPKPAWIRYAVSTAFLLLACASVVHFVQERRLLGPSERFVHEFSSNASASPVLRKMALDPSGDLAADDAVEAVLRIPQPDLRSRRTDAQPAARRERELRVARELMLQAIAQRPGWPRHRLLLGEVSLAAAGPAGSAEVRRRELWERPLWQAATDAPGMEAVWVVLGTAYLESWPRLSTGSRAEGRLVLRRALVSSAFLSDHFPAIAAALGRNEAINLLPSAPYPIELASRALSEKGDLAGAALLSTRRDEAERKKRAGDLSYLEQRYRRGDRDALRSGCEEWVSKHPPRDLDDPAGRAQVARVLELWPGDDPGSFRDDPRGRLVRFFLEGRESAVRGAVLARSLEPLSDVPDLVLARVKLLAGDRESAEELARNSNDSDPGRRAAYVNELARFALQRGSAREARAALDSLRGDDRVRCEVLLTRRDVARALGDAAELEALNQTLEGLNMRSHSAEPGPDSSEASLSFCVDPRWMSGRRLTVEAEVAAPAVLVYGWDGGRAGTIFAQESSTIWRTPLADASGSRIFSVRVSAGGPIREIRSTLGEPRS